LENNLLEEKQSFEILEANEYIQSNSATQIVWFKRGFTWIKDYSSPAKEEGTLR
jgi:hypothetical protein